MNAPSPHVIEGVVMACWWRIPPLAASPVDRLGFGGGETVAATNLLSSATGPHLPFIGLCDGAHQLWAGSPRSGRGQGSNGPLGPLVEINTNILPLDLIFQTFNLFLLHHKFVHRAYPIVTAKSLIDMIATIHISVK